MQTYQFINFLRLVNFRKKQLDVFSTVLGLREQRMKMVQKPEQYVYIFKCLRDEIRSQEAEGDYYDI